MKRLEKNQISELRETMPVLDSRELLSFVGGQTYTLNDSGQWETSDLEGSGNDTIVVNGIEVELKGSVTQTNDGRISFQGDVELFEFLVNSTKTEWGFGYDDGSVSGEIYGSNERHQVRPMSSFAQYDNYVHSHDSSIYCLSGDLEYMNGLPSKADIKNLGIVNEARAKAGLDPQRGIIYNEKNHSWNVFDESSESQQAYLIRQGYGSMYPQLFE